ncbi:MAG: signal peptidase I [Acidimicrobiales bacterium]
MTDSDLHRDDDTSLDGGTTLEVGPGGGVPEKGSRRRRRKRTRRRETLEWVFVVAGAAVVALVIKAFLFQAFYIPSSSMEPTLKVGDRVLVNKASYRLHDIGRGDVIVFRRPADRASTVEVQSCDGRTITIARSSALADEKVDDLIKRVVALPGERIERRDDGHLYIDDHPLEEPYVHQTNGVTDLTPAFLFDAQCIVVPDHQVFVLGDNRRNSQASNYFGPIDDNLIVGRAFVRVWPITSLSGL